MHKFLLSAIVVAVATGGAGRAVALPQFQKEFFQKYVDGHENKEFVDLVKKKAKCNVCHQGRKKKHNLNPYGTELGKLLDHKKDKEDVEKIVASLTKVGAMHSNAKDEKSPTFDALIAEGKLPGGDLESVLKEPKPKEGEEKK